MKLGANSVLFGGYDLDTAFKYIKMAGYDGIEIAAIDSMADQHLILSRWREIAPTIKALAKSYELELLPMERPSQSTTSREQALQPAAEIGIPIVNCGPGGKTDEPGSLEMSINVLGDLAKMAEKYGVTLCVKAHVGAAIYNTPTTLQVMAAISSPAFGIDMDPSHVYRAGENPVEALAAVVSRVKHVHIRDCKGRQQNPGTPENQANGRGDIDLLGYMRVLHDHGYTGPVDLEIIGAKAYSVDQCCVIAAEARGHMQASLQACGAR